MNADQTTESRIQFSLQTLMLLTLVIGVYVGVATMFGRSAAGRGDSFALTLTYAGHFLPTAVLLFGTLFLLFNGNASRFSRLAKTGLCILLFSQIFGNVAPAVLSRVYSASDYAVVHMALVGVEGLFDAAGYLLLLCHLCYFAEERSNASKASNVEDRKS